MKTHLPILKCKFEKYGVVRDSYSPCRYEDTARYSYHKVLSLIAIK